MKVRKLSANGDYVLGHGTTDFLQNTAEAVAQSVMTRLALWQGQWFIDTDEGTPWLQGILGKGDFAESLVKERILATQGVLSISEFESILNPDTRSMTITVTIETEYGSATLGTTIQ